MEDILIGLRKLPSNLEAIKEQGMKYLANNSKFEKEVINILHRPWVAPINWGLMLFNEADLKWFEKFTEKQKKVYLIITRTFCFQSMVVLFMICHFMG